MSFNSNFMILNNFDVSNKHRKYIQLAINAALNGNSDSDFGTLPNRLGSVLAIDGGKHFIVGANHQRNKCRGRYVASYHAELATLSSAVRNTFVNKQCEKGGFCAIDDSCEFKRQREEDGTEQLQ
jgi:hypothetical protein